VDFIRFCVESRQKHHIGAVTALRSVIRTEQHDGFYMGRYLQAVGIARQEWVLNSLAVFGPEVVQKAALSIANAVEADCRAQGEPKDQHKQE